MSRAREVLESLRSDGSSEERRRAFRAAEERAHEWTLTHPIGLEEILDWIDQLRSLFGDPPVDRTPWRTPDLRL